MNSEYQTPPPPHPDPHMYQEKNVNYFQLHVSSEIEVRPWGYKTFSCSTQLSMKFVILIIVGILTFIYWAW